MYAIRGYIGKENPAAAERTAAAILASIERLERFPHMGRVGRKPGWRELVVNGYPYVVNYRIDGDIVDIASVVHTSRKWPSGD